MLTDPLPPAFEGLLGALRRPPPVTGERMVLTDPLPPAFEGLLGALRRTIP